VLALASSEDQQSNRSRFAKRSKGIVACLSCGIPQKREVVCIWQRSLPLLLSRRLVRDLALFVLNLVPYSTVTGQVSSFWRQWISGVIVLLVAAF